MKGINCTKHNEDLTILINGMKKKRELDRQIRELTAEYSGIYHKYKAVASNKRGDIFPMLYEHIDDLSTEVLVERCIDKLLQKSN